MKWLQLRQTFAINLTRIRLIWIYALVLSLVLSAANAYLWHIASALIQWLPNNCGTEPGYEGLGFCPQSIIICNCQAASGKRRRRPRRRHWVMKLSPRQPKPKLNKQSETESRSRRPGLPLASPYVVRVPNPVVAVSGHCLCANVTCVAVLGQLWQLLGMCIQHLAALPLHDFDSCIFARKQKQSQVDSRRIASHRIGCYSQREFDKCLTNPVSSYTYIYICAIYTVNESQLPLSFSPAKSVARASAQL